MKFIHLACLFLLACTARQDDPQLKKYEAQAQRVTIIRDSWGIPHIYGKTDADAVFGLMYAQCEENFERVERAYQAKLGRLSEIDGQQRLYEDLLTRMLYDTAKAINDYKRSPAWLQQLCIAFADGVNYYLYKNDDAIILKHFEPWYALLFTDGAYVSLQTGGLTSSDLQNMYAMPGDDNTSFLHSNSATGSNAFAIAPSKTVSKNAMLYINPHVSFHFRMEAHMVSEEGLNAYGAITWGQFFIFQGFNEHCGWMHTSSMADAADLYREKLVVKDKKFYYQSGDQLHLPLQKTHALHYKKGSGTDKHVVTAYYTDHGPVLGKRNENWLSLKSVTHSAEALIQSWQRTKATNFEVFKKTLDARTNSTTNTMYADVKGNIAYWHGNFIPQRDTSFDYSNPVDGSLATTNWKEAHSLDEIVHIINPKQGFVQNCNSTPFSVSGKNSLDRKQYPTYMAPDGENFRSALAIRELEKEDQYTIDKLIALGYNNYLAAFDTLLPPLFAAYDQLPANDALRQQLKEPVELLRTWDRRTSAASTATTLAIIWGYNILSASNVPKDNFDNDQTKLFSFYIYTTFPKKRLQLLLDAVNGLQNSFGNWKLPWGEFNRYQRRTGNLHESFNDKEESLPSPFVSSIFGCLPAYEATWTNTNKFHGYAGNSFVAAVEFGAKIKAKAITPGGQSFDPESKHFNDQTNLFLQGKFRDVFFYKEDVEKNKERSYRPGE